MMLPSFGVADAGATPIRTTSIVTTNVMANHFFCISLLLLVTPRDRSKITWSFQLVSYVKMLGKCDVVSEQRPKPQLNPIV
jgi:hypothetical protein